MISRRTSRPPALSAEQRAEASAKAVEARRIRAQVKKEIAQGSRSIFDVINDPRPEVQKMRVTDLLLSVPGVGQRRAYLMMRDLKISSKRRIAGLGPLQLQRLGRELLVTKIPIPQGRLIVMSGPGGVGKSTISKLIGSDPRVWVSVSMTTRNPREGEIDGVDYFFVTEGKFDSMIASDGFLEWAEFAGARYGTPREEVENRLTLGKSVILEIEIAGARQIRNRFPEAQLVFISPPSWEELVARLTQRGTDSPERQAARLALAQEEMEAAREFDVVIVNHHVEEVVSALLTLATGQSSRD
jgi:guanylate kinase